MTQNWVRIFFLSVSWPATSPDRPFSMYVLQVLQSTSPDIGLFDIDLSGPSPVAASAPPLVRYHTHPRAVGVARRPAAPAHHHRATLKPNAGRPGQPREIHAEILAVVGVTHGGNQCQGNDGLLPQEPTWTRTRHRSIPWRFQRRIHRRSAPVCMAEVVGPLASEPSNRESQSLPCTMLPQEY